MKEQKFSFLSKFIYAVKLDRYQELAGEKFVEALKFTAKLMLIFAIVISIAVTVKFNNMLNDGTITEYLDTMKEYGIQSNMTEQMIKELQNLDKVTLNIAFYMAAFLYTYLIYLILVLMDIILLSIFGFLISRLLRIRLKYEAVYNIATYSLVLSIFLNMIYMFVSLTTNYTINYFGIVYNIISYIYLIAAILIIKSDIIKTNLELMAIVEEQEKVKQEMQQQEDSKEDKQNGEDEKQEDETDEKQIPEGENG